MSMAYSVGVSSGVVCGDGVVSGVASVDVLGVGWRCCVFAIGVGGGAGVAVGIVAGVTVVVGRAVVIALALGCMVAGGAGGGCARWWCYFRCCRYRWSCGC